MFIVTTNSNTAEKLKAKGFVLVSNYPDRWTFVDQGGKFDKEEYPDTITTKIIPT